ncbi:hypothetical protein BH23GEM10_BH23GEM10_08550 [soil metagenome]
MTAMTATASRMMTIVASVLAGSVLVAGCFEDGAPIGPNDPVPYLES